MKIILGIASIAAMLCAGLPAAAQGGNPAAGMNAGGPPPGSRPGQDPVAKGMPIALALEAAKAAEASCAGLHIGIAILDQAGLPKLYYIPDGTAGFHSYTGFRKANTALLIQAPSEGIKDRMAADKAIADKYNAAANTYMTFAGGLPIVVKGEVIGAIGVSGAEPSTKDEACAADGLKAVQARLDKVVFPAAPAITAPASGGPAQGKAKIVTDRVDAMKKMGGDSKTIGDYAKGMASKADALAAIADLQATSPKIAGWFVAGTSSADMPGVSYAKPEIWTDKDKFAGTIANLKALEDQAADLINTGSPDDVAKFMPQMGAKGCGGCHSQFREKLPQ